MVRRPQLWPFIYCVRLAFTEGLPMQQQAFYSKFAGLDGDLFRPMSNELLLALMAYDGTLTAGVYHHPPARWLRTTRQFPRSSKVEVPYDGATPFDVDLVLIVEPGKASGRLDLSLRGQRQVQHHFEEEVDWRPGPVIRLYNAYYGGHPAAPQDIVFWKEESFL
ncbi:MAG: hypothetical protein D6790_15035 [Caldilineae bacterium]|nr:MAG: hypothetical protein D6790_15035 [Caldilineae bacterium]